MSRIRCAYCEGCSAELTSRHPSNVRQLNINRWQLLSPANAGMTTSQYFWTSENPSSATLKCGQLLLRRWRLIHLRIYWSNMCGIKKLKIPFLSKLITSKSGKEKEKEKRSEYGEMEPKSLEPHVDWQPRKSAFKSAKPESSSGSFNRREAKKHVRFSHLDLSIIDDGGSKKNFRSPLPSSRRHSDDRGWSPWMSSALRFISAIAYPFARSISLIHEEILNATPKLQEIAAAQ